MTKRLVHLYRHLTDEECKRFNMPTLIELERNRVNDEIIDTSKYITHDEVWMDESEIQALRLIAPKG